MAGELGAEIGLAVARLLFPAKLSEREYALLSSKEAAGIGKWEFLHVAAIIILVLPCGYVGWLGCNLLADISAPAGSVDEPVLRITRLVYLLQAAAIGLLGANAMAYRVQQMVLGGRYPIYLLYQRDKYRIDERRSNGCITMLLAFPAFIIFGLLATSYVRIGADAIQINSPLSYGTVTHAYSEIESLTKSYSVPTSRSGARVPRLNFTLHFRDGSSWSSQRFPGDLDLAQQQALLEMLEKRTGLEAREQSNISP